MGADTNREHDYSYEGEGGGCERICIVPPCFAARQRESNMKMSIIRKGVILAACLTAIGAWTVTSKAASQSFKVTLNGAQQVPPVQTPATGTAELTYDPGTRVLTWTLSYSGLSGPATMAHFHGPAAQGKDER
jgi:CHRD domain-containing protein